MSTQKMSGERGLIVVMIVCLLALALVGGQMWRTNALEVVIGVLVGLALAVPVALLLVALVNGQGRAVEAPAVPVETVQPQGVRVRLGYDLGGIPMGVLVGGALGAQHILAVGLSGLPPALMGFDWSVRLAGPGLDQETLATVLGITPEAASGLTDEGVCWLSARGNIIGLRAEVG